MKHTIMLILISTLALAGCGGNVPPPAQVTDTAQVTGTWTGKLISAITGEKIPINAKFDQVGTKVSGVGFTTTPNACFAAFKTTTGEVLGHNFSAPLAPDFGGQITINTDVILNTSGKAIKLQGTYHALSGPCADDFGTLVLTN